MATPCLQELLLPHWQAHQDPEEDVSVEKRARRVLKELQQHDLAASLQGMTLVDTADDKAGLTQPQLAAVLVEYLDKCMLSIMESDNKAKDAVDKLLQLTAAVAADDMDVSQPVLQRAVELSQVAVDPVRAAAARTMGHLVQFLMQQQLNNKKQQQSSSNNNTYNDLLDTASQALLPLFTDKAQPVRLAAIRAGIHFFHGQVTDPDILQALLWSCQHDPSVTNRVAAVQGTPLHLESVDFIVQRVRDVKPQVRVAALQALQHKCDSMELLEAGHCVAIVQAGLTERCAQTKQATEQLICLGWMKLVKYDPIELLKHIAVSENDTVCDSVVAVLMKACEQDSSLLAELSDAERRAFRQGIDQAMVSMSSDNETGTADELLTGPRLFLSVMVCKYATTQHEKEALLNKLVPDMAVLCQYLDKNAGKLIQAIEDGQEEKEDELVFICVQLLKLAVVADLEEGSRRLLATALERLLVSVLTPDDLVEQAVCTLQGISRDDTRFLQQIETIVQQVDDLAGQDQELAVNRKLRVLAILSVVLEQIAPNPSYAPTLEGFSSRVTPALTENDSNDNQLVREASVSTLGKLGLFMPSDTVEKDYQPLMLHILTDENEKQQVRAQAMLALADWSLLSNQEMVHPTLCQALSSALERTNAYPQGLVCVAAEVAAKLILLGKVRNPTWLACLLVFLFDPTTTAAVDEEEEEGNVLQVGNPIRVEQVLTVFFPAFGAQGATEQMMQCLGPALELAATKRKQRGGRKKSSTWPMAKMLDYVVSSTEQEQETVNEDDNDDDDRSDDAGVGTPRPLREQESSVSLLACIQVACYLEKSMDDLSATQFRALCKWLGSVDFDLETQKSKDLSLLRRTLDEVEMATSDASALRALAPLMDYLSDISPEEEESSDEEEAADDDSSAEEVVTALGKLELTTPAKENDLGTTPNDDKHTPDRRDSSNLLELRNINVV